MASDTGCFVVRQGVCKKEFLPSPWVQVPLSASCNISYPHVLVNSSVLHTLFIARFRLILFWTSSDFSWSPSQTFLGCSLSWAPLLNCLALHIPDRYICHVCDVWCSHPSPISCLIPLSYYHIKIVNIIDNPWLDLCITLPQQIWGICVYILQQFK